MKIAISGKGGVGKSTLAGALSLLLARQGRTVLALDADPDANLASALGVPRKTQEAIVPISRQVALIEERTGAKVKQYGQMFRLNPEVSDIADKYALKHEGVSLLVLGAIDEGGSGCACPENVLIRALVSDLVLHKGEVLIMDMEAGIEHLGRATAKGVDLLVVVVEPGKRSLESLRRIRKMAGDIGLKRIKIVANKVKGPADEAFLSKDLEGLEVIGTIPWSEEIKATDQKEASVLDSLPPVILAAFNKILERIEAASQEKTDAPR